MEEAYTTGKGPVVVRARTTRETLPSGREAIVVTELPYQVNKKNLIIRIGDLYKERRLEGIADLRDESDRQGMRVVIELRRGAEPRVVLNKLFQLTSLQETFHINCLALVDGQPKCSPCATWSGTSSSTASGW